MSLDTFLADNLATADFGDWLVVLNPVSPLGVTTPFYFSHRGTAIGPTAVAVPGTPYTIPANTPFRRRLTLAPTTTHSLWQRGRIGGESHPTYGGLQLVNQDGGLDQYRVTPGGWRWKNTPCQVYFCDTRPQHIASTIGCVFDGLVGECEIDLRGATISLTGFEARYGEMTSERVFRGTGYQLGLAIDATVDYGAAAEADITGDLSLEFWLWIDTAPTGAVAFWGWTDGTEYPWRLTLTAARALRLRATIGGSVEGVLTTATLAVRRPYHISIDIDGRDATIDICDDDAQVLTTETFLNAFSAATRDGDNGGKLKLTVVDATAALWFDEMRVWDVARTSEEHRNSRFGEIEDGAIPAFLVHYPRMNDGTGNTATDSAAGGNDGAITVGGTGSFAWLWAMEGGSELANTPKPEVWGYKYFVAPVLVDGVRSAYSVSPADTENSLDAIVQTFEGGNPHIMDAEATSLYAFITTTPAAGHCLPYSARGLFRLSADPELPISATVSGFGASASLAPLPDVAEQLITTRLSTVPTLDTASFTALGTAVAGGFGVYLARPEPIRQTLDFLLAGAMGWWGHYRGEQAFHVEQFTGPGATPDHEWDERHIVNIEPVDAGPTIYGVEVKFNQNHTVLSEDQVAVAIKGTADWLKWTQEWQYVRRIDPTLKAQFAGNGGIIYSVETARRGVENVSVFADFLFQLLAGAKEAWKVTIPVIGRVVRIGQTCTLSVTLQRNRQRLSLDGTARYVILDVADTQQRGEVVVTLWGGAS